jgi:hypothetical protein
MKRFVLFCFALVAMALAYVPAAQAVEGYEGFSPVADYAMPVAGADIIGPLKGEDSAMPQLEAADLYDTKPNNDGLISIATFTAYEVDAQGAVFEVGWRSTDTI